MTEQERIVNEILDGQWGLLEASNEDWQLLISEVRRLRAQLASSDATVREHEQRMAYMMHTCGVTLFSCSNPPKEFSDFWTVVFDGDGIKLRSRAEAAALSAKGSGV